MPVGGGGPLTEKAYELQTGSVTLHFSDIAMVCAVICLAWAASCISFDHTSATVGGYGGAHSRYRPLHLRQQGQFLAPLHQNKAVK